MSRMKHTALMAAIGVLAVPGAADAAKKPSLKGVEQRVERADRHLDRAVRAVQRGSDTAAAKSLSKSRSQLSAARRDAERLRRAADTGTERSSAARALAAVAAEQGENIVQLAQSLAPADGALEVRMARTAHSDARSRDAAVSRISALLERGMPDRAATALTRVLGELSSERSGELETLAAALASEDVSETAKSKVDATARQSMSGQATAAAKIEELLASGRIPAQARKGLERALGAVRGDQAAVVQGLASLPAGVPVPEHVRELVDGILGGLPIPGGAGSVPQVEAPAPTVGSVPTVPSIPVPTNLPIPVGLPIG